MWTLPASILITNQCCTLFLLCSAPLYKNKPCWYGWALVYFRFIWGFGSWYFSNNDISWWVSLYIYSLVLYLHLVLFMVTVWFIFNSLTSCLSLPPLRVFNIVLITSPIVILIQVSPCLLSRWPLQLCDTLFWVSLKIFGPFGRFCGFLVSWPRYSFLIPSVFLIRHLGSHAACHTFSTWHNQSPKEKHQHQRHLHESTLLFHIKKLGGTYFTQTHTFTVNIQLYKMNEPCQEATFSVPLLKLKCWLKYSCCFGGIYLFLTFCRRPYHLFPTINSFLWLRCDVWGFCHIFQHNFDSSLMLLTT